MKENYSRCDICNLLVQYFKILFTEFGNSEANSDAKMATLLEMKCYYWLIKAYSDEFLKDCDCDYSKGLRNIQKSLKAIFIKEKIVLDVNKKKCDICKILPCEIFALLDGACSLHDVKDLDSMVKKMEYHVVLAFLYDELIGKCMKCSEYVEYISCLQFLCDFIESRNQQKLQNDVFFWKMARNNDEIWNCSEALNMDQNIECTEVDLENHITVYLDFNVYQRYESDDKVKEFFKTLIQQDNIDIIYSGTHLEEVLRMGRKECETRRINSIQELTGGKIAVVGKDKKTTICIQDINQRLNQVMKYLEMNIAAEERECIVAEAREKLCLHEFTEQQDKAIGSSSLREILSNLNQYGKKNELLPSEEDINKILQYVGNGNRNIREYMDALQNQGKEFIEMRTMIVSIATLLNILGLHGDKIKKKTDSNAVYPIYCKDSFRTIRSGYYDNNHLVFATGCTYFVTTDDTLCKKAKEIYDFLGVDTKPILLKDFVKLEIIT